MIELGLLLGKIVPMNVLAQLPLHFVHRLRDLRIRQVSEANRQNQQNQQQMDGQLTLPGFNNAPERYTLPQFNTNQQFSPFDAAAFAGTSLDDIIDELT